MRIKALLIILSLSYSCSTLIHKPGYAPGFDFALFEKTPLNELSKAVEADDTAKIMSLVSEKSIDIDYQEPKFGNSILTLALQNNRYLSTKKLLSLGANSNIRSPKDNSSPFLLTCKYIYDIENAGNVLSLLIHYGADVNSVQIEEEQEDGEHMSIFKTTALEYLCRFGTAEEVKILVENGARLNVYPRDGDSSIISNAILNPRLDIMRYLLIEKKVPIPDYTVVRGEGTKTERKISLREEIGERKEAKDVHQQQLEDEILNFLKDNDK